MDKSKFSNEDLTRWKREINPAPIIGKRISLHRVNAEYEGNCPDVFHVKRAGHPDTHPSFKVYKMDDGIWAFKCFSCGANGNVFQFVQSFDGVKFQDAVTTVLAEAGVSGWADGNEQADTSTPEAPQEQKAYTTFPITQYAPAVAAFEKNKAAHKWFTDRGISAETAKRFYVGFVQSAEKITPRNDWMTDGWVLFPTLSADGKTITSVKYRSLVAKKMKKVGGGENSGILRAPNTSTTLFNFNAVVPNEDIWIVEGEPDTLVMDQAGLNTVGFPMAEYKPTDDECEILSSVPKRRFIAGDNDAVGTKLVEQLQKRLRGATYVIRWPNNRKDANDVLTNECGNDPSKFKALVDDLKQRATQTESEPILRDGDQIKPKRISWLWENKIPLGKITLFVGNPDNGKSLASTSVAAICSAGRTWPETKVQHEPADVLMLLGEDDLEDTAVPRLLAADAHMSRIHFLEAVRPVKQDDREVRLDLDIPAIEKQLETNSNIRLIIIDPISNYLGDVSMVAEQEVRSIMIPLKRAAEKFNVAIVIVMHLNKKSDLDAISRVGGAMAFVGVARCSWLFARNVQEPEEGETETPEEEKNKNRDTFSMLRVKNNLVSSNRAGMSYSVAVKPIPVDGEPDIITPYVIWGGMVDGSADEVLGSGQRQSGRVNAKGAGRPNDKLQEAINWLQNELQDSQPHPTKVLREDAKNSAMIKPETLDRAWVAIKAKSIRVKGVWCWQAVPMNETAESAPGSEEAPRQSNLIGVDGVE